MTSPHYDLDCFLVDVHARPRSHIGYERRQRVGAEQVELEVLGAAADRVEDFLGVRGRKDEDHVRRRLLESLE